MSLTFLCRALVLTAPALLSCSTSSSAACDAIACSDAFAARLTPASPEWPNGAYVVTLQADAVTTTCSFRMPDDAGSLPACTPASVRPEPFCASLSCPPGTKTTQEGIEIDLPGNPATVALTITRDATTVVATSFSPTYRLCGCAPNGLVAYGVASVP